MNKFHKILKRIAIVCGIIAIVGIIATGILARNQDWGSNFNSIIEKVKNEIGHSTGIDIEYNTDKPIKDLNSLNKEFNVDDVKSININCDLGNISIIEDENINKIIVDIKYLITGDIKLENNIINVDVKNTKKLNLKDNNINENYIVSIKIPKDKKLESLNLDNNLGEISIKNVKFKHYDLNSDLGDIKIKQDIYTVCENMKVATSMGRIDIDNMDCINGNIDNNMGDIKFDVNNKEDIDYGDLNINCDAGRIESNFEYLNRNITLENNMGEIDVYVKNKGKNIDFDLNVSVGKCTNNLETIEDSSLNERFNVNISADMGSVNINN